MGTDPAPAPSFLTARWVHLALLNYVIDPALLASRVPAGTALDCWDGRCFISMVGFQFLDTRLLGRAIPFHRDFDEVNLRFYVRRDAPEGSRRGVVFVKELVPRFAIAWAARTLYNENYLSLPMSHRDEIDDPASGQLEYGWYWRGRWNRLAKRHMAETTLPLHRRFSAMNLCFSELGRRAASRRRGDHRLFVSDLVDLVTGLLSAEVSPETARLLDERKAARGETGKV